MSITSKLPHRLVFNASRIAVAHTYLAYTAFFGTLGLACLLHFKKIVKNGVAGYPQVKLHISGTSPQIYFQPHPQEWFPSVSAT